MSDCTLQTICTRYIGKSLAQWTSIGLHLNPDLIKLWECVHYERCYLPAASYLLFQPRQAMLAQFHQNMLFRQLYEGLRRYTCFKPSTHSSSMTSVEKLHTRVGKTTVWILESRTCQGLSPLAVPVGLPPVWVLPVDDVQDVTALKRDAQLVARDVQVVVRFVVEVGTVMKLQRWKKTVLSHFKSFPKKNPRKL